MKTSNTPWRVWTDGGHVSVIEKNNPLEICAVTLYKDGRHKANAELIVKAVNEHAALVAVAEAAERHQDSLPGEELKNWATLQKALAALAAVRAGSEVAK